MSKLRYNHIVDALENIEALADECRTFTAQKTPGRKAASVNVDVELVFSGQTKVFRVGPYKFVTEKGCDILEIFSAERTTMVTFIQKSSIEALWFTIS